MIANRAVRLVHDEQLVCYGDMLFRAKTARAEAHLASQVKRQLRNGKTHTYTDLDQELSRKKQSASSACAGAAGSGQNGTVFRHLHCDRRSGNRQNIDPEGNSGYLSEEQSSKRNLLLRTHRTCCKTDGSNPQDIRHPRSTKRWESSLVMMESMAHRKCWTRILFWWTRSRCWTSIWQGICSMLEIRVSGGACR